MAQQPRHVSKKQREEMMKRRRITTMIIAGVLLLVVLILIVNAITSKKDKKTDETTVAATKDATTTTTEPETEIATVATTGKTDDGIIINKDGSLKWEVSETYASAHTYCVGVNRAQNTVTVYTKDKDGNFTKPYKAIICSCGREGHETPLGTYTTSDGKEWLYMADATWGQYARRFNGSIYFHSVCYYTKVKSNLEYDEFNKLGGFASLGCVRMCVEDAKWIYENLEWGTKVVVYDADVPGPLGKPDPIRIDVTSANKGWDPTDPDPANPWKN